MATISVEHRPQSLHWTDAMRRAARAAYERRLEEVRQAQLALNPGLAPGQASAPGDSLHSTPAASNEYDPIRDEEALRLCMVKYWPKVVKATETHEELTRYFQLLFALESHLDDADDLRFFDAWNQAFEALSSSDRLRAACPSEYPEFLAMYAEVLRSHLSGCSSLFVP